MKIIISYKLAIEQQIDFFVNNKNYLVIILMDSLSICIG